MDPVNPEVGAVGPLGLVSGGVFDELVWSIEDLRIDVVEGVKVDVVGVETFETEDSSVGADVVPVNPNVEAVDPLGLVSGGVFEEPVWSIEDLRIDVVEEVMVDVVGLETFETEDSSVGAAVVSVNPDVEAVDPLGLSFSGGILDEPVWSIEDWRIDVVEGVKVDIVAVDTFETEDSSVGASVVAVNPEIEAVDPLGLVSGGIFDEPVWSNEDLRIDVVEGVKVDVVGVITFETEDSSVGAAVDPVNPEVGAVGPLGLVSGGVFDELVWSIEDLRIDVVEGVKVDVVGVETFETEDSSVGAAVVSVNSEVEAVNTLGLSFSGGILDEPVWSIED